MAYGELTTVFDGAYSANLKHPTLNVRMGVTFSAMFDTEEGCDQALQDLANVIQAAGWSWYSGLKIVPASMTLDADPAS